ncbi:hypothetical protein Ahy_B02g059241 [Arachis hypogaea]|uniref:Uncharacterized protein n=1 Tax=Arachis hypogaea TaxID=3818 RepID=A0A445AGB7_ARAHY|nr:hypothetical protein Ahy_B02g059241 [Arachis hypogaea]
MDPPIRDSESNPKPLCENKDVVFIDTNLDTHLAVLVSDHDTVSDLKDFVFPLQYSVLNVYDFVQLLRRSALAPSMFEKIASFVF